MVKVHGAPVDCSRWTKLGLKHILAEAGFPLETTVTGSWGNRMCIKRSLRNVRRLISWFQTLKNEPNFPIVVWALAIKPGIQSQH